MLVLQFLGRSLGAKRFFLSSHTAPASTPVTATRVLFLDIDGVVNSVRTCLGLGGFPHNFSLEHHQLFDHVALGLLRGLCRAGGVSVVLSSTWRITHSFAEVAAGLDLPVVDRTPRLLGNRGDEIADWLARHPHVTRYAIVDDDSDMLPSQYPYFVKTSGFDGLLWADFAKLCELFSVSPYDCSPSRSRVVSGPGLVWDEDAGG